MRTIFPTRAGTIRGTTRSEETGKDPAKDGDSPSLFAIRRTGDEHTGSAGPGGPDETEHDEQGAEDPIPAGTGSDDLEGDPAQARTPAEPAGDAEVYGRYGSGQGAAGAGPVQQTV